MLYWLWARLLSSQQERAQYQWLIIMKTRICIFLDSLLITTPKWIFLLSTMYTHSLFLHWDIIVKKLLEVSFLLGRLINVNLVKRGMMWYFSSKCNQNYRCDFGKIQNIVDLLTNLSYKSSKLRNSPRKKNVGGVVVKKRPWQNLMEVIEASL